MPRERERSPKRSEHICAQSTHALRAALRLANLCPPMPDASQSEPAASPPTPAIELLALENPASAPVGATELPVPTRADEAPLARDAASATAECVGEAVERAPAHPREPLFREVSEHLAELHSFVDLNLGPLLRRRESVSDIVQSTLRQVLASPEPFDYEGPARLRAYLCAAALNKILEKRRFHTAQRRDLRREGAALDDPDFVFDPIDPAPDTTPTAQLIERESNARLRAAFDSLDEDDRSVLTMRRIFNLSLDEIAAALAIAPRTVTYRLANAQARLAAILARGE